MPAPSREQLIEDLRDTRARTLELIEGLSDEQLMGPPLAVVNPLRWEIGHVAYFHELWVLRHLSGCAPLLSNADALYDSIGIEHDLRWDLPLPSLDQTLRYMQGVLDTETRRLEDEPPGADEIYLIQYAVLHEDMHTEAFTYTRQTLGYPRPRFSLAVAPDPVWEAGPLPGDAEVPGGIFMLGAEPDDGFCFDNEKWAHPVNVKPFRIARAPVTNREFADFIEDGGYRRRALWSEAGWQWRRASDHEHPVYWQRDHGAWRVRLFDELLSPCPHAPVIHVSWYEAQAYCCWVGRRLPTEAEWELAAAAEPARDGNGITARKRRFPWGDTEPTPAHANLDGRALGCIDVGALPLGDSAFGCRQMIGNVWEWTSDTFRPYPGFVPDMYKEYSEPLFGKTRVLKGGSWATRGRLLRNTWRNYYGPERNDVFAGFRTCAL